MSLSAIARRTVVVGTDGMEGRLPGSVPADATPSSTCDVLVVHATG